MASSTPAPAPAPATAVPISPSSNTATNNGGVNAAPYGASATSSSGNNSSSTGNNTGGVSAQSRQQRTAGSAVEEATGNTPNRLSRGNSFRIPLPPNSPSSNNNNQHGAISPSSPGSGIHAQLGTSYGSTTSTGGGTGSRLGNFALGFRRNRGASTNRGEITSPVVVAVPPPSPPAFPSLQASTSLTDFGIVSPYFEAASVPTGNQATSPSGHAPSSSITGRGYFTRRGFGRKNTGGLLSGGRTPTSEQPPTTTTSGGVPPALNRSRSSSQPSLPLSSSANNSAMAQLNNNNMNAPSSANAATMVFSGTSQPVLQSASQTGIPTSGGGAGGGTSSNDSSRRASGEATRGVSTAVAPATTTAATSSGMHQRTTSQVVNNSTSSNNTANNNNNASAPSTSTSTTTTTSDTHHIRLVPHLESTRSLHFDPVSRDIQPTIPLRIGRFTDRNPNQPISSLDQNRIAFKSKVVSRTHAEIWYDPNPATATSGGGNSGSGSGGWFIRDLKSSSGTFLNHIRLSGAGMESRPFPIRDGDVLQLGVDYQGGTEEIYRCVKMRIELNRGWQRGASNFNTNALRQIRALGNVTDQVAPSTSDSSKKKKSKKRKSKKNKKDSGGTAMATDENNKDDDGNGSDGMQVDKKAKEKEKEKAASQASPSGVTDCCICLFSVTVYQALFIAPCSHIFHFKCIRPLLMQHHPGFSCPLCRTFGDLEADVEQDDVPEPVVEESSSSSSGESESEEEEDSGNAAAPALPDKNLPANATVNTALASEHTAVHNTAASSDPNLDTLRPGRRSPLIPSVSEFGSVSASQSASISAARASPRASLDVVRPASPRNVSGTRTPPSRGSRVSSSRSVPPLSGAAVAAALEPHVTTPHQQHNHYSQHSSHHHSGAGGDAAFSPPSAGDFDPDIRRGSIYVHGADGHAMQIPITGRSRPGSVHEAEISSDIHHHHHNNHQSPSVSAAEKSKARSVKSMRMTKSKNSIGNLSSAAASAASPSHGASTSAGHRRRPSAPSSDEDEDYTSPMDVEDPLTARPQLGDDVADSRTPTMASASGTMGNSAPQSEDVDMEDEHDTTPPMSNKEDSEGLEVPAAKGKGKDTRSASSSTHRDPAQNRRGGADSGKQAREEASASVHAIV